MRVRYYSTQRPVVLGGFPKREAVQKIRNFGRKTYCGEIGREAWGYIEYREPLTKEEADAYELTSCGMKTYYCVTSSVDDWGKVRAAVTNIIEAACRPESGFKSLKHKDIYHDWFDKWEDAMKFVKEAEMA